MASVLHPSPRPTARVVEPMPILYEDEDEGDMGESNPHVVQDEIARIGVAAHLAAHHPQLRAYSNMNLYYRKGPPHPRTGSAPYVSPDLMVVEPKEPDDEIASYTIGTDGPVPRLTLEILSVRSAQQRDLTDKLVVYAQLGVPEYVLVDRTGRFLPQRLLLKRLQSDGTWKDELDADGGVTSQLGFRIVWDADGFLRVLNAATGLRYVRPMEAQREAEARQAAEDNVRREAEARQAAEEAARREAEARHAREQQVLALQAEVQRLQAELAQQQEPKKKGRRKP